ncbi:glutathione S-transferase family protein [Mesorhizobium sp. CAU 1741]|uniref:glutathione S-transferase family protein n=1 Tax=Mesorhizobium sp. CAU 1741 TaxID=3140366 RepID=UPI00325C1EB7
MLVLYHAPISTCSQKVRLVLAEKQLDWEGKSINFGKAEHLTPDYLKLNPNGVVPTLVHDGDPIIESSVITEYLDEAFPDHPVRPKDFKALAHMRAWRQYIDEVPTPSIRPISFNTFFVPIWSRMSEEEFWDYTERLPLRKHFYRKMGRSGFSPQEIEESLDRLAQALARMEDALQRSRFLAGDQYTLADVNMTPTVVRLEDCGRTDLWDRLPRVADWYERIKARQNFDIAYMPGSRDLGAHI